MMGENQSMYELLLMFLDAVVHEAWLTLAYAGTPGPEQWTFVDQLLCSLGKGVACRIWHIRNFWGSK